MDLTPFVLLDAKESFRLTSPSNKLSWRKPPLFLLINRLDPVTFRLTSSSNKLSWHKPPLFLLINRLDPVTLVLLINRLDPVTSEKYFSNSVDYQTIAIIDENLSSEGNTMDLTPFVSNLIC